MKVIQKTVTVDKYDGRYHNFFFSPYSYGSLASHMSEGWIVKHISDNQELERAFVLFERVEHDNHSQLEVK